MRQPGGGEQTGSSTAIAVSTPFTLTEAAKFELLVAVILLVVKIVWDQSQQEALYLVALLAGLTDVDAITLSMSQHARGGGAEQFATIAIKLGAA